MLDARSAARINATPRRAFLSPMVQASYRRAVRLGAAVTLLTLATVPAFAQQPSASTRERAANHYDRGVDLFERGQYTAAVTEFLAADELVPSSDALVGAIAAARRSNDHLLVVRAAE